MKHLTLTFLQLTFFSKLVASLSPAFLSCQLKKTAGVSPRSGCPSGTLYVSPTDRDADFNCIQDAIDSLPSTDNAVILIGEGQYFEMLNVTRVAPLTLLGQLDPATAFIQTGNASQRNLVQIWNNLYASQTNGLTDEETATLTVAPALDYSFGNIDFKAYNIDFENRAADYAIGRALVTSIMYANASFYGCSFRSWQDTWYTGPEANTFVFESIIYGQTDCRPVWVWNSVSLSHTNSGVSAINSFSSWFQSVILAIRACGGGITAWKGTPGTRNGVYIAHSRIVRSPDADPATVTTDSCYLGRPWNSYAVAVFLWNYMDDSINFKGFRPWNAEETVVPDTTYYAEYQSYGPGGNTSARVSQYHNLTSEEAEEHTLENVFGGVPAWIDVEYQY